MYLTIAKTNGVLWSGEADSCTVPGVEGELTVLTGHTPLVTTLRKGVITVKKGEKELFVHECERGILEVTTNDLTLLL